jgi:hypothetical protein
MGIKLQSISDIQTKTNEFFVKSIENVKNTKISPELKGFKIGTEKALHQGRIEGLEASQKAVNVIIDKIQEEGGFR